MNGLSNCFYKDLPSYLGDEFFFPSHHSFGNFSWRSLKVFTFDFPPTMGRPRYFSQFSITLAPINVWISALTSDLVFLLMKIDIFCLFIS